MLDAQCTLHAAAVNARSAADCCVWNCAFLSLSLSPFLALSLFFPSRLVEEMSQSLPQELDFANEARNSERARANLRCDHRSDVNVPRIFWNATRKRVLTMERMDGCVANDVAALKRMGIDTRAVSSLLSQVFSEMIFLHGFVHADPHAGNVLVQRRSATDARPRLILLDHGLYRELTREFRLSYAHLWQSLIRGDREGIETYAQKMNAGDMYPLFASMLTRKTSDTTLTHNAMQHDSTGLCERKVVFLFCFVFLFFVFCLFSFLFLSCAHSPVCSVFDACSCLVSVSMTSPPRRTTSARSCPSQCRGRVQREGQMRRVAHA